MKHALYLAWAYLAHQRLKTTVLVASVALIAFLPAALQLLVQRGEERMGARAAATPLLVGRKGSPTELVLNALYFRADVPATIPYAQLGRVEASGRARGVPLHVRFRSQDAPIVGTSLDYFDLRGLRCADGRFMTMLGQCVVGSAVAAARDLAAGDHVVSSPEQVFDLAGSYPLRMQISGVLAPTGTPDDRAIFVDVKTAWVIEGLAHGHDDVSKPEAAGQVLERKDGRIVANASVKEYQEITPDNIEAFHFHGDPDSFPLTAIIAVPHDARAGTLLRGEFQSPDEDHQILEPAAVVDDLLDTVFAVKRYIVAGVAIVGLGTLATMALVFGLSIQLRRREIETMRKIGGAKGRIAAVLALEVVAVLVLGLLVAGILVALTGWFADALVESAIR